MCACILVCKTSSRSHATGPDRMPVTEGKHCRCRPTPDGLRRRRGEGIAPGARGGPASVSFVTAPEPESAMQLHVPNLESVPVVPATLRQRAADARAIADADCDQAFVTMLRSFRETGGLARGDEVAEMLVQRGSGDVSKLAR